MWLIIFLLPSSGMASSTLLSKLKQARTEITMFPGLSDEYLPKQPL